jgi:hypothetical protein
MKKQDEMLKVEMKILEKQKDGRQEKGVENIKKEGEEREEKERVEEKEEINIK